MTVANDKDQFEIETESIEQRLNSEFNGTFVDLLKKISYEVSKIGLTEEEACSLLDYDYAKFKALKQKYPVVAQLFNRKNLEYKRTLLKKVSESAAGNDKLAQWLLAARYPDEYAGRRGGKAGEGDEDTLGMAIAFIQKNPQGNLIASTSGNAFALAGPQTEARTVTPQSILKDATFKIAKEIEKVKGKQEEI